MSGRLERKCRSPNSAENRFIPGVKNHVGREKGTWKAAFSRTFREIKARKIARKARRKLTKNNGNSEDLIGKQIQIVTKKLLTSKKTGKDVVEHNVNTVNLNDIQIEPKKTNCEKKRKLMDDHTQINGEVEEKERQNNQTGPETRSRKRARKEIDKCSQNGVGEAEAPTVTSKRSHPKIEDHIEGEKEKTRALILSGDLENARLLFLTKRQKVCIKGAAQIEVLVGSLYIFGSILRPGHEPVNIFSTSISSLIAFSESSNHDTICTEDYFGTLQNALQNQPNDIVKMALLNRKRASSVLLMKSLQTVEMNFVCSFQKFQGIFNLNHQKDPELKSTKLLLKKKKRANLSFILAKPKKNTKLLIVPGQWKTVSDIVQQGAAEAKAPVVLICGGQDVGKSTFARYLANSFLNSRKELYFLECDVGQTEFTPPGLISLNKISSPLLGPPFTHLQQPERSVFFGDISPRDKPGFFMQCIHYVYQTYADNYRNKIPLIVNTQGWIKGLGVPLLFDVIRLVQPSHIIQFKYADSCKRAFKNLPKLTTGLLTHAPGWVFSAKGKEDIRPCVQRDEIVSLKKGQQHEQMITSARSLFQPVVLQLDARGNKGNSSGSEFAASDKRVLALLSYFSRIKPNTRHCGPHTSGITSLLSCVPYSVPWKQVAIHIMHTELPWDQILYSVNASVVGLGETSPDQMHRREDADNFEPCYFMDNPIAECIGLGIVRNVDPVRKVLYVLTPLPLDTLQRVNTLLKGNLEIPAALLLSTKKLNVPYVTTEFTYHLRGAGAKKMRHNLLRRRRGGRRVSDG